MYQIAAIVIFVIWIVSMFVLACVLLYQADNKIKRQKECIEQIVDMLRSYQNEPIDMGEIAKELGGENIAHQVICTVEDLQAVINTVTYDMLDTIFSEMLQYIPENEREALRQKYESER